MAANALVNVLDAVGVAQVPSPRRNVDELAVPEPRRAVPTVPDAKFEAFNEVSEAPLPENDVPVTAPVKLIAVADKLMAVAVLAERSMLMTVGLLLSASL